jgi:hypothetical protein
LNSNSEETTKKEKTKKQKLKQERTEIGKRNDNKTEITTIRPKNNKTEEQ